MNLLVGSYEKIQRNLMLKSTNVYVDLSCQGEVQRPNCSQQIIQAFNYFSCWLEEKYVIHERKQAENIERMQRNPIFKILILIPSTDGEVE